MQFYIKGDDDKFIEATQEQLDQPIKGRIKRAEETAVENAKEELAKTLRTELTAELTPKLTETLTAEIEGKYKSKVEEAEAKANKLDTIVRQKTIAAEYGFKPELESFLGEGSDDEMRKLADTLKKSTATAGDTKPNKETSDGVTPTQAKTGIVVEI